MIREVQHPLPYQDTRYNENLSPAIPVSLGREVEVYGTLDSFRHPGVYHMATQDVWSVQLTLRPGWTLPPDLARQLVQQAGNPQTPPRRAGVSQPALPWQVGP